MFNIFKRRRKKKQRSGWTLEDNIAYGLSLPKGYVSLSNSPEVITAVDRIADLISNMAIHLMENTDDGDIRVKNSLSDKIDYNPCIGMTKKSWLHFIVRTLLLEGDGNAVVIPEYSNNDGTNYIENLIPVPAKDFAILSGPTFRDGYKIQIEDKEFDPENLLHFKINPDPNEPWRGTSYRIVLGDLLSTLDSGEKIKQTFMNGRYMPSLVVKVDSDSDELMEMEGHQKLLDMYSGAEKAGQPWIIPSGLMDVQTVTPLSLNDIGVVESLAQDKETIAALLGVPSFFLGVGEFNVEEYNNFVKDKVLSIAKEIEQTLTSQLLLNPKWYFKFNVRSLYAYDMTTLAGVGGSMFDKGIMTGNEVRDWLGLSPIDGLSEVKILENYIPAEDSGNQKKLDNDQSDNDQPIEENEQEDPDTQ